MNARENGRVNGHVPFNYGKARCPLHRGNDRGLLCYRNAHENIENKNVHHEVCKYLSLSP